MRVPTKVWLLGLCVVLAGCGAAPVASLSVQGGGNPPAPTTAPSNGDAVVVSGPVSGPLTPLSRRTTGSVTLRTFLQQLTTAVGGCSAQGGECVPDWCQTTMTLVTEVSTPAMAAVLDSPVIGLDTGSRLSVLETDSSNELGTSGPGAVGVAEGSPVQMVAVHVAPDVEKVTMHTADGKDSTTPVQGLAVLGVAGSASTGALTALDAGGHTVATVPLPAPPTSSTSGCQPQPIALPTPGPQPADAAAAEAAVRKAFATAFTAVPGQPPYASLATVQDGDALHNTLDQLRKNFPDAAASSTVTVSKIVFTNPATAAAQFTLNYTDGLAYGTQIGTVVLENNSWLIARDTYCQVMAFGAAPCPPD
jgi:hypothetical protein